MLETTRIPCRHRHPLGEQQPGTVPGKQQQQQMPGEQQRRDRSSCSCSRCSSQQLTTGGGYQTEVPCSKEEADKRSVGTAATVYQHWEIEGKEGQGRGLGGEGESRGVSCQAETESCRAIGHGT